MILVCAWAIVATVFLLFFIIKMKIAYRKANRLLDQLIEGRQMDAVPWDESGLSLLSHQLKILSDKLKFEISRADSEKEQIKQLISNLSHQLKTPLANVMMYEELLGGASLSESQRACFLQKLMAQTKKIDWLLESLFKMSKLEQNAIIFEPEAAGIKETIRSAVSAVYEKAENKGIAIRVQDFDDVALFHNPKWTAEVFVNLLENAIKYMPAGQIEISLEQLETYSMIHVKDNGMGIPKEDLPYIFGRFYRSRNVEQIEGSGIGLYLSKLILEKEKGYMTVRSELEKGSVFSVFLQNC